MALWEKPLGRRLRTNAVCLVLPELFPLCQYYRECLESPPSKKKRLSDPFPSSSIDCSTTTEKPRATSQSLNSNSWREFLSLPPPPSIKTQQQHSSNSTVASEVLPQPNRCHKEVAISKSWDGDLELNAVGITASDHKRASDTNSRSKGSSVITTNLCLMSCNRAKNPVCSFDSMNRCSGTFNACNNNDIEHIHDNPLSCVDAECSLLEDTGTPYSSFSDADRCMFDALAAFRYDLSSTVPLEECVSHNDTFLLYGVTTTDDGMLERSDFYSNGPPLSSWMDS